MQSKIYICLIVTVSWVLALTLLASPTGRKDPSQTIQSIDAERVESVTKTTVPAVPIEPTGEEIDLSLQISATHPSVGETIWVDVCADSIPPREYNFVSLYLRYNHEHLTLLDWAPGDIEWKNAGFPGRGKDIEYICLDETDQEYTCNADICRDDPTCTKIYTDFVSTVIHHIYDNRPCPYTDDDPTDEFTACFEEPPVARPINQEIDDGEAQWIANGEFAMTPNIPVRFSFRVRQRGVSCIRISKPWMPFPGGNRWGSGPPDYEHNVTKMTSQVLLVNGPNLVGTLSDVCVDNQ